MIYLAPIGGLIDYENGILTTPAHKNIPIGIKKGMMWAADNEAFTRGFDPTRFFSWLKRMKPYRDNCLFIAAPDVVGDAALTLDEWRKWSGKFDAWPLAFVAQDGQEKLSLPDPATFTTLFIGGSTKWKESMAAVEVIRRGQALKKRIHIGRVNWRRRYDLFNVLRGSNVFTYDGTRCRYDGVEKTIRAWRGYQAQSPLITI